MAEGWILIIFCLAVIVSAVSPLVRQWEAAKRPQRPVLPPKETLHDWRNDQ